MLELHRQWLLGSHPQQGQEQEQGQLTGEQTVTNTLLSCILSMA